MSLFDRVTQVVAESKEKDQTDIIGSVIPLRRKGDRIEVLIGRHKSGRSRGGADWLYPGGRGDEHEDPEVVARREYKEETGLKAGKLVKIGVSKERERSKADHVFATAVEPDAEWKAHDDFADAKWVAVAEMPKLGWGGEEFVYKAVTKLFGSKQESLAEQLDLDLHIAGANGVSIKLERPATAQGIFIVFEGVDGVGKTTQVDKLVEWLKTEDYAVASTRWASGDLFKKAIRKAKDEKAFTPTIYSLAHAADLRDRYDHMMLPMFEKNGVVVADRYIWTSIVRDGLRGANPKIIEGAYAGMRAPDLVFHCVAPQEVGFARLLTGKGMSYYGSGMDLALAPSKEESALRYQALTAKLYDVVLPHVPGYVKLNTSRSIGDIAKEVRKVFADKFGVGRKWKAEL